jgi:hypothetical protein
MRLKTTKELLRASIGEFNQYVMPWFRAVEGLRPVDVEALQKLATKEFADTMVSGWVAAAQEQGTGELLPLTGDYEAWWEHFQKSVGANS